jgi:hypothetical protein
VDWLYCGSPGFCILDLEIVAIRQTFFMVVPGRRSYSVFL